MEGVEQTIYIYKEQSGPCKRTRVSRQQCKVYLPACEHTAHQSLEPQ